MSKLIFVSSLFLLTSISGAICCTKDIEAEQGSTNGTRMHRSEASSGLTVLLRQDDYVQFGFTVVSSVCDIVVNNVAYSNDGLTDNVTIFVATESGSNVTYIDIGQFPTLGRIAHGDHWNVIQNSGPVGRVTAVSTGRHILTLEAVSTDYHGVELDTIKLTFTCNTAGGSTTNECPEFELNSPPDDGGGLSVGEIVGIVGVVIAVPSSIAGCIAVVTSISCVFRFRSKHQQVQLVTE